MKKTVATIAVFAALAVSTFAQGNLTPPGAPAATMKTLAQIEPRIDLATVAGDASYHHIISQPGSYYLSANVEVTKGYGIQINATDVTLDLNGFSIFPPSGYGTYGISISPDMHRATVRNGSIVGFMYGIRCHSPYAKACRFEGLAVSECTEFGIRAPGFSTVFNACRAHNNSGNGIDAGTGASLQNCTASYNEGSFGIHANFGSTLQNCTASYNKSDYGIWVSDGSTVRGCSAYYNKGNGPTSYGIYARYGSVVVECSSSNNGNTNSVATSSQGIGICVNNGSTVKNCTVQLNKGDGIRVNSDSLVAGNNCDSNGQNGDGAGIHSIYFGNRILGNNVTDNDRGIDVDNVKNIIQRNTASGNALNWDVAADNACLVVSRTACAAISGNSGGTAPGSTDPNANFTY